MSCLNKKGNFPKIPALDSIFKSLSPSNIAKGASSLAGKVANQVKNAVDQITGKVSELGGLLSGSGKDMKSGFAEDLKKIKPGIAKALTSAKNEIASQFAKIGDLLDCEESTTDAAAQNVEQSNKIQNAATKSTVNDVKSLSNKEVKEMSESPTAQAQKTTEISEKATAAATEKSKTVAAAPTVVATQKQDLEGVETAQTRQISDKTIKNSADYITHLSELQKMDAKVKQLDEFLPSQQYYSAFGKRDEYKKNVVNKLNLIESRYTSGAINESVALFNVKLVVTKGKNIVYQFQRIVGQLTVDEANKLYTQNTDSIILLEKQATSENIPLI